jgi:hypothetical protein
MTRMNSGDEKVKDGLTRKLSEKPYLTLGIATGKKMRDIDHDSFIRVASDVAVLLVF